MTPEFLRTTDAEDETKTLLVRKSAGGTVKWAELVNTVIACGAVKVEALSREKETVGVWQFPGDAEAGTGNGEATLGYSIGADDTESERLLKTIAHLLADAHKHSADKLCSVLTLQTQHFADERRNMASTFASMDRAMQRMARGAAGMRIRVESPEEENDEEETKTDGFVEDLVKTMLQKEMRAQANGTAKPEAGKA